MDASCPSHKNRPGFFFNFWGGTAVSSLWWARVHLVNRQRGLPEFFHAVLHPCFVLDTYRGRSGRPRVALYRLQPGLDKRFVMPVLEKLDDGLYVLVSSIEKQSIALGHQERSLALAKETCDAYCLRNRDLEPGMVPPPQRWSVGGQFPPPGCCESPLDCPPRPAACRG